MFILDTFMLPLTHTYTLLRVLLQQVIVCRLNADLTRSCKRQRCAATSHLPSSHACLQTYVASAMPRTLFLCMFLNVNGYRSFPYISSHFYGVKSFK